MEKWSKESSYVIPRSCSAESRDYKILAIPHTSVVQGPSRVKVKISGATVEAFREVRKRQRELKQAQVLADEALLATPDVEDLPPMSHDWMFWSVVAAAVVMGLISLGCTAYVVVKKCKKKVQPILQGGGGWSAVTV